MNRSEVIAFAQEFLAAWNSQDVDRVVACYTDDLVYRDPSTGGEVHGAAGMRRYLTALFRAWEMRWSLREAHPLAERDGAAVLWHATLRPARHGALVETDGMDLVLMRGDRIERNEVWFDRSVLAAAADAGRSDPIPVTRTPGH